MNTTANMINNSTINVAILNSKILGENVLESYIPFVSTLISVKHYKEINIEEVCTDFYEKYFFKIPAMPMKEILSRMQKKEMISRDKRGKIIPNFDKIQETDFELVYKETLRKYENISNNFIEYAKEKFNLEINHEITEECFSQFIKENYLDTILNDENIKEVIENMDNTRITEEMYAFYSYVIHTYKTNYESFKVIQSFCMGYIVANALSIDNVSGKSIIFKDKKIFFDTNFILRLLGLEGEFYKESYCGIIDILKENNCELYVFPHTYDEIINILETAKQNLNNTTEISSEVQKYFCKNNNTVGDIVLLIATLDKRLNGLGIYISKVSYDNTSNKNQIDEQELYNSIIDVYSNRKNFDEKAKSDMIWNDVKSMALVYRDLNLVRAYSIQTLKDVFITTNKGLAYACKNFNKSLGKKDGAIAPCMTDIFLGTILWIQNPIRYDNYNEKQILASCYSSIKLDNKSLTKFLREAENLKNKQKITNEEYMLMRDYDVIKDMLSDKIMGNSDNIDEKTTYEVIQEVKGNITSEYKQLMEEQETKYKQQIEKKENESIKAKEEKDIAERKYNKLLKSVKLEAMNDAKKKSILKICLVIAIEFIVIVFDLYFNIIDNIGNNAALVRIIIYIMMSVFSVYQCSERLKNYKKSVRKLYKIKLKKMQVEE